MTKIRQIDPVKLFVGIIYQQGISLPEIGAILSDRFGEIDLVSSDMPFDYTDYYSAEMGTGLCKRLYSFEKLIDPIDLSEAKLFTNEIEQKYLVEGKGIFNLDPGYLDLPKVVLASAKDFSHRIYIGKSIFAEITLSFVHNKYTFLPWTYSDYKTEGYLKFFYAMRNLYRTKLGK